MGDPNAPQLIIENRALTMEYAREREQRPRSELHGNSFGTEDKSVPRVLKSDWLCDQVKFYEIITDFI